MSETNKSDKPVSSEEPKPTKKSALGAVNPLVWGLVAVVLILALAVGFLLADRNKDNSAEQTATAQKNTATTASIDEAVKNAEPGKKFSDGTGDPMIVGPGGELKEQDDVLNVHRRNPKDPFGKGAIDAPVVITEFSDFECPFCANYENKVAPEIYEKYVKTGLVRLEWNDFPINGEAAVGAAKAGRAAAAQGKFWEFKKELFDASKNINGHPNNDIEDFVRFAKAAGVKDLDKFRAEATDDTYTDVLKEARAYASAIGLQGTPGFLVGTSFVNGAQPIEVFEEALAQELEKVNSGKVKVPGRD